MSLIVNIKIQQSSNVNQRIGQNDLYFRIIPSKVFQMGKEHSDFVLSQVDLIVLHNHGTFL